MKRNDSKEHYTFINGKNLEKPKYVVSGKTTGDDCDKKYYWIGQETLNSIFSSFNIPMKYRKVAMKINSSTFSKITACDCTSDMKYNINAEKIEDGKFISGYACTSCIYNRYYLKTKMTFATYEEIINFYRTLKREGLLENYLEAISQFYKSKNSIRIKRFNEQRTKNKYSYYIKDLLYKIYETKMIQKLSLCELQALKKTSKEEIKRKIDEEINKRFSEEKDSYQPMIKVSNKKAKIL